MIDQLAGTIEQDGDPSYHLEKILEIQKELCKEIDVKSERELAIKGLEDQISYNESEYQKELERCKNSNEWMEKFFESIKNNERPRR
jgi:hypothetical protein